MMSCSDSAIEQNGARPSYWRIIGRRAGERASSGSMALRGQVARSGEAELAHVCSLAMALIAPVGLAEGVVRARHVEDVVHDLEQDAELACIAAVGNCGRFPRAG